MKPEVTFVLENAAWPALLVESPGVIRRANRAAVNTFGARVKSGACPLASIWSDANAIPPEEFLLRAFDPDTAMTDLQVRVKSGLTDGFLAQVCPVEREGHRYFAIQFLKAHGGVPAPARPAPATQAAREPVHADSPPATPSAPVSAPVPEPGSTPEKTLMQSMAGLGAGLPPEASTTHKQKVDSALQLTRTVALDFNNALTSILGHTSLVLSKMEPGHPWRNSLLEVERAAGKAAEIAQDLAEYGRQEKSGQSHAEGNLNDLLRRSVELFKSSAPQGIEWKLHLESKLCAARFDEAKMQQAFVKLLENAVEAISGEGRVVVFSRNRHVEEPSTDGTAKLSPGWYVCVEISDTGCGIAPESLPRVFEPFYTTKAGHRGLGLALVYGIITNHGGTVAISSQPGAGATARVYLPAQQKIVKDKTYRDEDLRGTQTILIVDDEDLLLTMGQMILSSYGYRVLTANNGQKALDIVKNAESPIDLVLTDLIMPQMSGRELMEQLKRIAPGVPIICMTGYVRNAKGEDDFYLQKPFTSQGLLSKVKQVLSPPDQT